MTWLFRGKVINSTDMMYEEGKWVRGGNASIGNKSFIITTVGSYIESNLPENNIHIDMGYELCQVEVDPDSVSIWTGEEATNGKIFLGDKVEFDGYDITDEKAIFMSGTVVFKEGTFYVDDGDLGFPLVFDDGDWTITGNIHEGEVRG